MIVLTRTTNFQRSLALACSLLALGFLGRGASNAQAADEPLRDPFLDNGYNLLSSPPEGAESGRLGEPLAANPSDGVVRTAYAQSTVGGYDGYGVEYPTRSEPWDWQILPDGVIYKSYMAGPRESRLGTQLIHNRTSAQSSEWLWDATLGGRRGLFRFGNNDPVNPEGWQLDLEGAALVRLNVDEQRDVDASDFRFGVPLTYGEGPWQVKFGYYHLSSHKGDERIIREGEGRFNYVRDAIILGLSYDYGPVTRVYGEVAHAFFVSGGAEPWELQFGVEFAEQGVTGPKGSPFLATNAHLRGEVDFSGDWTLQAGWLWRGDSGSTFRAGVHYMNGLSTQYQFFRSFEEQFGAGIWYDF